ncbi:predicted protein, partial [Nematostella vectensis]
MADGGYGDPENPFADPSVTDMTSGASRGLGDFNPFAEQDTSSGLTTKPSPTTTAAPPPQLPPQPQAKTQPSQPAVLQTHQDPPPYVIENEQENLRKRQEDLERKAAELQRKEQELQRMQYSGYRENNFPPLPKWFKCKPCFYHDIQVDIPIEYQKLCRFLFIRWQAYSFVMFYNFIVALALLSTSATGNHNEGKTFGLSILYLVWNVPASFLCWYRPAYKALKNDSSFSYIIFFLIFFLHISINIYYTLGMPGGGSCGFITATDTWHGTNKAVSIMMFICAAMLLAGVGIDCILIVKVHRIYRQAGASLEKAQGEFAKGVATNPHVQTAAAAGVRNAMSNQ